jgi:hypothetical protein
MNVAAMVLVIVVLVGVYALADWVESAPRDQQINRRPTHVAGLVWPAIDRV